MTHDTIDIKLADGKINKLPTEIAYKSHTIHKKCLWKKRLAIPSNKPIVVANITSQELELFKQAYAYSPTTFMPDFFERLSSSEQKILTSVAGKTKLNSPELTLLLLKQLPTELLVQHIAPHFDNNKKKILHYLRCAMIKKNNSSTKDVTTSEYNMLYHPNGYISYIPATITTMPNLCTPTRSDQSHPLDPFKTVQAIEESDNYSIKSFSPNDNFIFFAGASINDCKYNLISKIGNITGSLYLCRIKKDKANPQQHDIRYTKINGYAKAVAWSPDGKLLALNSSHRNPCKILLITLDPESETIISNKQFLDVPWGCGLISFNNHSTALVTVAHEYISTPLKFLVWDRSGNLRSRINVDGVINDISFNCDDSRLIATVKQDDQKRIMLWDTTNLDAITQLSYKDIPVYADTIRYSPYHRTIAAAHTKIGNAILIEEASDSSLKVNILHNNISENNERGDINILFSPEGDFIITKSTYLAIDTASVTFVDSLATNYTNFENLSIWDIKEKKRISLCLKEITFSLSNEIILSSDCCTFITNNQNNPHDPWVLHTLYTPDEHATNTWIHNCSNIFKLYALNRIYQAHKNQESLSHDDYSSCIDMLEECPPSIKECILNYLPEQKAPFYQSIINWVKGTH